MANDAGLYKLVLYENMPILWGHRSQDDCVSDNNLDAKFEGKQVHDQTVLLCYN